MAIRYPACAAAAFLLATAPAFACQGDKVLFSDDFKQVDSSWGFDSPDVTVEEGKVKIKPQPDISNLLIYKAILFSDADYCVTVRMPNSMSDLDNTMAGSIFWAQDYDNYYMFMITPSGYAEITRKVKGKWIDVVEWRQVPEIKRDIGAKNVLEIETRGNTITASINGAKFASVKGQVPDGGGQIGMRAQSEKNQVDTWKFTALKVTNLKAPVTEGASDQPAPVAQPAPVVQPAAGDKPAAVAQPSTGGEPPPAVAVPPTPPAPPAQ